MQTFPRPRPEFLDADPSSRSLVANVLVRGEPEDEEDDGKEQRRRRLLGVNVPLSNFARLLSTQPPSGFDGFALSPSGNPEEMNPQVSSNRLGDEQSIRSEHKDNSP
jgi:hypothetical protein